MGFWINGITSIFGKKTGGWPGGSYSWGPMRLWIPGSNYGRSGFSIHGGLDKGSAGCIDCLRQVVPFLIRLQNYSNGANNVPLIVDYGE